jgi:hypothetical protein
VETYLIAERDLVTAVDAVGGKVLLPDAAQLSPAAASLTLCQACSADGRGF